jgi:predicted phage tail protein
MSRPIDLTSLNNPIAPPPAQPFVIKRSARLLSSGILVQIVAGLILYAGIAGGASGFTFLAGVGYLVGACMMISGVVRLASNVDETALLLHAVHGQSAERKAP